METGPPQDTCLVVITQSGATNGGDAVLSHPESRTLYTADSAQKTESPSYHSKLAAKNDKTYTPAHPVNQSCDTKGRRHKTRTIRSVNADQPSRPITADLCETDHVAMTDVKPSQPPYPTGPPIRGHHRARARTGVTRDVGTPEPRNDSYWHNMMIHAQRPTPLDLGRNHCADHSNHDDPGPLSNAIATSAVPARQAKSTVRHAPAHPTKRPKPHAQRRVEPKPIRMSGGARTQRQPAEHPPSSQITREFRGVKHTGEGSTEDRTRARLDAGSASLVTTCRPIQREPARIQLRCRPEGDHGTNPGPNHPRRHVGMTTTMAPPNLGFKHHLEPRHWCYPQVGEDGAPPACPSAGGPRAKDPHYLG